MICRRFWNVKGLKGFPSPGRQSGGLFSTSPRLCQSVFFSFADQGIASLQSSPGPLCFACETQRHAASGLALDGVKWEGRIRTRAAFRTTSTCRHVVTHGDTWIND